MKTIARIVTRPNKEHPAGWDIGIVMPYKSAGNISQLKPNHIYELVDIMGQLVFREVGECCMSDTSTLLEPGLTWAAELEHIIHCMYNVFVLTKQEFLNYRNRQEEDNG
jgi:hypothetical protein